MSKKTWPFLLIAFSAAAGFAATEPELSPEEAVRMALDRSHLLAASGQAVAAAVAGERVAKAELLPELAATGFWADYQGDVYYARFINPAAPGTANPQAPPTDAGDFSSTQVGLVKLSQPLYSGGALRAGLEASRLEGRVAEQKLRQARLDLAYQVRAAYYGVLLADRAVEVARQSVERSEETVRAVEKRREAEEALAVEALGAGSQLARDRHGLVAAENEARFARLALNRLLGRPPDAVYVLNGKLEGELRPLDEEEAVRSALASPGVEEAKLRVSLAETQRKAARSHLKPKIALEAFYTWIDNETLLKGTQYGAVVNVSIPFAKDVAAGAGEKVRSAAQQKLAESSLEELLSVVELQARQAVRQTQEAYGAVEVLRQALAYQQEKYRVTASAFREKLATTEVMLEEHTALAEADLELDRALYQARLSEAQLLKVVGEAQ